MNITHNNFSQDISSIGKEKNPLKISGSIAANQIFYAVKGIDSRRQPYNYFLNGNVNFSLYGWNVPVSFSYSNQQASFRQPFNQYGIQPTYKWVKGYIGYNSMVFSPYTLNGHVFLGGGVELTPPGIFRLSAMYGRFQKPVKEDTSNTSIVPSYQRMGGGIKVGVGKDGNFIDLIIFKAQDYLSSLDTVPQKSDVLPSENMVVGLVVNKKFGERITFASEYASSAYTRDKRGNETNTSRFNIFKLSGPLYKNRTSSSYNNALKANINYRGNGFGFGLGYERIDPNYQTMGAYYFNNDLENYTINATKRLLRGKMNIAGNFGIQRNNVNNDKMSTMKRWVGALNVNYAPFPKLNLAAGYSNFQTVTRIRSEFDKINQLTPYNSLDTLNYVQVTQSTSFSASFMPGDIQSKEKKQNLNLNLVYQVAGGSYGTSTVASGTKFYNGNLAYSYLIVPKSITITGACNANYSLLAETNTFTVGPTLSLTKGFKENKIKSTVSSSWNKSYVDGNGGARVLNLRLSGGYVFRKKHNIGLSLITLNRNKSGENQPSFTEFTGTLSYSYQF